MATIKMKEIEGMNKADLDKKLKELKLELVKSKVSASKTGTSKIKEIKKIIARIKTFNTSKSKMEALNK